MDEIALAVAVEVHRELHIGRRQELGLPDLASPVAAQFGRRHVAAVDDAKHVEEFPAKLVGPAAIMCERRHRADDGELALIDAEVGFQPPDRGEHRRGDAELPFNAGEGRRMLRKQRRTFAQTVGRDHSPGKLLEGLGEDTLAAVAGQRHGVVDHAVQRRCYGPLGNALRRRLALEFRKPCVEFPAAGGGS